MADTLAIPAVARPHAVARAASIPWYIWCGILGITSAMIGVHWDISWHRSIGRDTFWTPAHLAIHLCGILAGLSCGYLILSRTFGHNPAARAESVRIWGLRGPLGAFISAWGGFAMLTSAPFDDWWHSAYGLDVKILSPPHILLIFGMLTVELGVLILVLGAMNRAEGAVHRKLEWLFLYASGMVLVLLMILVSENTVRPYMHLPSCYTNVAITVPVVLAAISRASNRRWASTIVASIYMGLLMALIWILPLFPAEPKLGPVYRPVTHFIPWEFPLLLVAPALALDLLWPRIAGWNKWLQAALAGFLFLAVFWPVQWYAADFLQSPAARNAFFGAGYHDFLEGPQSMYVRYLFWPFEGTAAQFWTQMGFAFLTSILMTRLGLGWGDWMRKVRR